MIAEDYLDAYYGRKYEKAEQYISQTSLRDWHAAYLYPQEKDTMMQEFIVKDVKFSEDMKSAIVYYYVLGNEMRQQLRMVKDNETWKVIYERRDAMGVAKQFLEAFNNGDFELAKEYVTENAGKDLDHMKTIFSRSERSKFDITGVEYNNSGTRAVVYYKEQGASEQMKINLKRVNGEWKITFAKLDEWDSKTTAYN